MEYDISIQNSVGLSRHIKVAVIGGGAAGLMAAEVLSSANINVELFDAMPSVGRKFLMAGKGGMNITHSEGFDKFISRYSSKSELELFLHDFTPDDLRDWLTTLGVPTFIGTSGRVFPVDMKAAPLLRLWLHRLRQDGVNFYMRHKWQGLKVPNSKQLVFLTSEGTVIREFDAVILALGGGSWSKLGSTGEWTSLISSYGVSVLPLKPANCGFEVKWSAFFREKFAGVPLKSISLSFVSRYGVSFIRQGELIISENGIEGGLIYAASALLRDDIACGGYATIYLDLLPHISQFELVKKLSKSQGKLSLSNYLRKLLGFDAVKIALIRELLPSNFTLSSSSCALLKAMPIVLVAPRPLDEAISSAGGVDFGALDEQLMIKVLPGVFCAGEMLNWEAPTGGYLLTACFATGRAAARGVINYLSHIANN